MRTTTVFNKLLKLVGAWVTGVEFDDDQGVVFVDVTLRRRHLVCPHCGWQTAARHNWQPEPSTWRALDFGTWQVTVRCRLRRLCCQPCRTVVVEAVPFARHRARFTRDFDDVVAWLAQRCDKTAITQLMRVNWRTTGAIIDRVVADRLDDSDRSMLVGILATLPAGTTELGCHPGVGDDFDSAYGRERAAEVAALCDPRVRAALAEHRVHLRPFHGHRP